MGDVRLGPERVAKTWVWAGFSPSQPEGWHFGDLGHPKLPVLRFVGGERGRGGSAPARTPRDGRRDRGEGEAALVAACFEHGAPPRTHLPPADEQVLPEDDDEVHAAAVIAIRRRVEGRRTRSKLPRRRRRSTFLRAVPSRNLRPARHPIKLPSHHPRSSGSRHQSTVSSDPPKAAGIPA